MYRPCPDDYKKVQHLYASFRVLEMSFLTLSMGVTCNINPDDKKFNCIRFKTLFKYCYAWMLLHDCCKNPYEIYNAILNKKREESENN